jgi:hypothetical protein
MLRGPWPRVTADGVVLADVEAAVAAGTTPAADLEAALERLLAEAIGSQVECGMGLVTDGLVRWADPPMAVLEALKSGDSGPSGLLVRSWKAAAAMTDAPLAQVVPGPYTLAMRDVAAFGDIGVVNGQAGRYAGQLGAEITALAEAGCAVVVVDEPAAVGVGENTTARDGFMRAHHHLLRDVPDVHAMLAIAGGSAHEAGPGAILGAPYHSFLFDLAEGPDNWYLVRAAPGERGIVCAALKVSAGEPLFDQAPELVWAAQYAASANARGMDRVGLANASSLRGLAPDEAMAALRALAKAAELAELPHDEAVQRGLDPRAVRVMPGPARTKGGPQ